MSNQNSSFAPQLEDDDKLTPVMIYTSHSMVWGQVFSKQAIRVSTWLNTEMAPTYMKIFNGQLLLVDGSNSPSSDQVSNTSPTNPRNQRISSHAANHRGC